MSLPVGEVGLLTYFFTFVPETKNDKIPNPPCLVGVREEGEGTGEGGCWPTFQLLFPSTKMTKSQVPRVQWCRWG